MPKRAWRCPEILLPRSSQVSKPGTQSKNHVSIHESRGKTNILDKFNTKRFSGTMKAEEALTKLGKANTKSNV
jgi:hypothetical protein